MLPFTNEGGIDRIVDFCTTLKQVRGVPKAIGYLLDEGFEHHRHDICLIKDNYVSVGSKTLDSLLQLSHKRVSGFYLSQKDRLHLAVVLASSVLQLDGTSWLKKQWRSCDIFFLQTENPLPNVPRIDYAYPYLSTKISSDALRPSSNTEGSTAYTAHLIRCEVLFALGLTLIELSFGETLVGKQIPDDVDNSEIVTSYRTANRLLDYVYNESGSRYGDVVRRCIQCPFDVRHPNLDNEEFQQAVFEYIVTPLVQDLEDFNGGSRIR